MRIIFSIIGDEAEADSATNIKKQFEKIIGSLNLNGNTEAQNHGKVSVYNGHYDSNGTTSARNPFVQASAAAPDPKPTARTRSRRRIRSK